MKRVYRLLYDELLLVFFIILFGIISVANSDYFFKFYNYVDWRTIIVLSVLLIIITGLKESKILEKISCSLIKKLKSKRNLAIFMVFLSYLLSWFVTNDITLFIVVPITLSFKIERDDIIKLLIFETIAVNSGSSFTPIGNPQNIFIFNKYNIHFLNFLYTMLPINIILLSMLIIFIFIFIENKKLQFKIEGNEDFKPDNTLAIISFIFLILFIISLEFSFFKIFAFLVLFFYILFYRKIIIKSDWVLILMFILMFIIFNFFSSMEIITRNINKINLTKSNNLFFVSVLLSQIISNVPATIFLSKFTLNWRILSYGVNIGGNGFFLASFANLITLRLARRNGLFLLFHKFSLLFLILTALIVYLVVI